MAEKRSSALYLLAAAVVLEAVAVLALAIGQFGACPDAAKAPLITAPAPTTPAAPVTIQREVLVPVVQFDTDKLAEAVADKVEAKASEKIEARVRALIAATPVAKPSAPVPVPSPPPKPTTVPAAPKMPPPPEGSYVTKFGAHPATGPEDAPVLVFILSDFQCPVCKRAADGLKPLLTEFPDVRWIFWNNPLDMHRRARAAATASMAAFRQGKFWEYHDALFENSRALEDADLEQVAASLGLDMETFRKDLGDNTLGFQFDANMRVATMLEARGTPSFVINGRKQVGWGSAGGIQSMVQQEVDASRLLVAQGKTPAQARAERAKENAKTPEDLNAYLTHMLNGEVPPAAE
ncbi:MAG: thioredoxin domain-containing protein [Pseudomonadota bacterium]